MKAFVVLFVFVTISFALSPLKGNPDLPDLPTLHRILNTTLSVPYSCGGSYQTSALFLSSNGVGMNHPDLLYNGACGSKLYFDCMLGGDDFCYIADLGDVRIEDVTASKTFNWKNVVGYDNTYIASAMYIAAGHTYAVSNSRSDTRSLFAVRVNSFTPDGPISFDYAVLSYSIIEKARESPGFKWTEGNKW